MLLDIAYAFKMTFWVSQVLASIASIGVLVVSLIYCLRRGTPPYMRVLPLYFFLSDLTEVIAIVFPDAWLYDYGAFIYIDGAWLLYFFTLLPGPSRRTLSWWLLFALVIPSLAIWFFTKKVLAGTSTAAMLESIVLIIPSVLYYRELFKRPKIAALEKDPSFWMVTGIFFYYFIRIPVVWFTGYYYQVNNQAFLMGVYSINNYTLVISFALFTKAMVCLTK